MDKLNNKEHFKIPKGYFKDFNTNLSLKRRVNPFIVPSNYFEDFNNHGRIDENPIYNQTTIARIDRKLNIRTTGFDANLA